MLKVGVTGGIGSGKSTVCRIFEVLGIPVYYADVRAHYLIENHDHIVKGYKKIFGNDVYSGGKLNKQRVADLVFSDTDLLNKVNELVHPVVHEDFSNWVNMPSDVPYVVEEAAVLLESGGYEHLDKVILVSAPEDLRIKRVVSRDHIDQEKVMGRIKNQWTDDQRRPYCDYEIVADNRHLVVSQVLQIHQELLK